MVTLGSPLEKAQDSQKCDFDELYRRRWVAVALEMVSTTQTLGSL